MKKEELLKLVSDAYDHACEKHPFFANRTFNAGEGIKELAIESLDNVRKSLEYWKDKGDVSGSEVLDCELAEAHVEYCNGDKDACRIELAQCAAVILRMIEQTDKD